MKTRESATLDSFTLLIMPHLWQVLDGNEAPAATCADSI